MLGVGGFATVYRAHDPRLNSDVAIKLLAENHSLNPRTRERFLSEANALRRVQSSSVVSIFDIQQTSEGQPYLVLEFADRGTLAERRHHFVTGGQAVRRADVMFVVEALTDALDAIHAENLVHRDVTPANLLLRSSSRHATRPGVGLIASDETLLLSDLGLVKDLSDSRALTVGGGTAGFSAPEQAQPLGQVDARSDIWAATAIVGWLITGSAPFHTLDWRQQVLDAGFNHEFLAALERGLSEDPDDRPSTASAWQHSLSQALNPRELPRTQPELAATKVIIEPDGKARRMGLGRVGQIAAVAMGAVALAIVGFMLTRGGALNPDAVRLPGGDMSVSSTIDEVEITIVGPEEITVGETVTYRADVSGVAEFLWIDPLGTSWRAEVLDVMASSPGRGSVAITASTADGQELRSVLQFEAKSAED